MRTSIEEEKCTGCTACQSICPFGAIEMVMNNKGFLIPYINNKCRNCNLCRRVCPVTKKTKTTEMTNNAYAFKCKDDVMLKKSSSGGFFSVIANYVIEQGGYVCGCILDNLKAIHIVTNDCCIVDKMKGSKYVQSDMGNCFVQICKLLERKKKVLFTGTSCQVDGLKTLLEVKGISDEFLLCIDFICHGVPSPKIWEEYIRFYEKEKYKKVVSYYFRNKKYGWGENAKGGDFLSYVECKKSNGEIIIDEWSLISRMWKYIFFSNLCLCPSCYKCSYAKVSKPSDITMADFWGINKIDATFNDNKGTSLVIIQNDKGNYFLHELKKLKNVVIKSVDLSESTERQVNVFCPSKPHERSDKFWGDYRKYGFDYVLRTYFNYCLNGKLKGFFKRLLFELGLRYLY